VTFNHVLIDLHGHNGTRDTAGNRDPSSATYAWTIKKQAKKSRHRMK
jgi:hypothetical protein